MRGRSEGAGPSPGSLRSPPSPRFRGEREKAAIRYPMSVPARVWLPRGAPERYARFPWTAQACVIARVFWSAPGRPVGFHILRSLPRGAERRQTRGCAKPPMGGGRGHPVGRFAKASPPFFRREAPPGAPLRRSANVRAALSRTWTSHAVSQLLAPGPMPGSGAPPSPESGGTFAPSPRRRIDRRRVSPHADPVSPGISPPLLTAARSSRRPMTTPLEEQDEDIGTRNRNVNSPIAENSYFAYPVILRACRRRGERSEPGEGRAKISDNPSPA